MDRECAFCGRAESAARHVYCEDCQANHKVCPDCAVDYGNAERDVYAAAA
jgi:hypothetical protein